MALTYVVDRIEGETAVLVDSANKRPRNVAVADLPKGAKPGTTLVDDCGKWSVDAKGTEARAAAVDEKMANLFKK